ncbi:MAG TPA: NAD(P)/FAD-dependent oxidoreductase [Burkholderiales bacterium]|nr:NAD(P)/FAD-dependent oxidoreductase [Burkholderiales bacterium]
MTVVQEEPTPARTMGWVPAQLQLSGLTVSCPDPWLRAPLEGGGVLELSRDIARSVESIRRTSAPDAEAWPRFCERMATLARLLERVYVEPPPSLVDLRFAFRLRRLGRQGLEDLMRLLPMPAAELLDDWFESDVLKGALGSVAVRHLLQGPRSAGTAFRLLHYHAGSPPGVFRVPASNLAQLLRARVAPREAKIARITVRAGEVTGVALEGGEELRASVVVSAADPRRTLIDLVEPGWLDPDLVRALGNVRSRGVAAKVALTLERAPDWKTLTLAPSLDYVERAYDDAKYGRVSARPWLDVIADGKNAEVHVQYAKPGADTVAALTSQLLKPYLPITDAQVLPLPVNWPDGQPHQAELALDQALWMRPLPELAGYRTPIKGLWLGGQAMHPAVPGVAGYNCARQILRNA